MPNALGTTYLVLSLKESLVTTSHIMEFLKRLVQREGSSFDACQSSISMTEDIRDSLVSCSKQRNIRVNVGGEKRIISHLVNWMTTKPLCQNLGSTTCIHSRHSALLRTNSSVKLAITIYLLHYFFHYNAPFYGFTRVKEISPTFDKHTSYYAPFYRASFLSFFYAHTFPLQLTQL